MHLRYSVVVADTDHWPPEELAAAEAADDSDYESWVVGRLDAVMRAAGEQFHAENRELFAHGTELM